MWKESVMQTAGMLKFWANLEGNDSESMKLKDTAPHTHLMSLHIISGAGFGVQQVWDNQDEKQLGMKAIPGFNTKQLKDNHKMAFKESLEKLLKGIILLAIFPEWFLRESCILGRGVETNTVVGLLPFPVTKKLMQSYSECADYYQELFNYKLNLLESGETIEKGTMDLMGMGPSKRSEAPSDSDRTANQGFRERSQRFERTIYE